MKLSVLMPVYNERATIEEILRRVQAVATGDHALDLEIIVVDNCSTDGTRELLREMLADGQAEAAETSPGAHRLRIAFQAENKGKGASVRRALALARGEWIIIQDGDLEYDPNDYHRLLRATTPAQPKVHKSSSNRREAARVQTPRLAKPHIAKARRVTTRIPIARDRSQSDIAVFGTRLGLGSAARNGQRRGTFFYGRVGLSLAFRVLYGRPLSDVATCYKLMRRDTARALTLRASGFDLDFEIAARLARRGVRIREVPVSYYPRDVAQGKKIRVLQDGARALWTLLKLRFA